MRWDEFESLRDHVGRKTVSFLKILERRPMNHNSSSVWKIQSLNHRCKTMTAEADSAKSLIKVEEQRILLELVLLIKKHELFTNGIINQIIMHI